LAIILPYYNFLSYVDRNSFEAAYRPIKFSAWSGQVNSY